MKFIENKWLLIILVAAFIEPFHYFLLIHYPPEGKTFMAYDSDEALVSGIMRSIELNFDNPWSPGEKVFFNGALTSPYTYIPLGYLRLLLGVDAILMNIMAKFVFFFIFLMVLSKFMKTIIPEKHKLAFAMFLLPLGLMPVGYLIGGFTGIERFAEGFSFEFSVLNNISRVYYFVPLITGMLSFIFFNEGRKIAASISLGATFLFYPFFGFAFAWILFLYDISGKKGTAKDRIVKSLTELWKIYAIGLLFLAPWLYARFAHPEYFGLYSQNSLWWRAHLISIIGSYFFLLSIILLANVETFKKFMKFIIPAFLASVVIILSELSILNVPPFTSVNLPSIAVDAAEIVFMVTIAIFIILINFIYNVDGRKKFLLLFALAFILLSIVNPKYIFWMQYRMGYLLHIPLALLAALYFDTFILKVKSFGISKMTVLFVIGIFAVSSFLAYNYRFQMADRKIDNVYFEKSDKEALIFLNTLPRGIVIASDDTNYFLPTWSGQYALYHPAESQYQGGGTDRLEKKSDASIFYTSNISQEQFKGILKKYDVRYVFYGSRERNIGAPHFESYNFLEKIYDNRSQIFIVKL